MDLLVGELIAVVGCQVDRNTALVEQLHQARLHILAFQTVLYPDDQALARELIDDVQHAEGTFIMGAIRHKVIAPDMDGIRVRYENRNPRYDNMKISLVRPDKQAQSLDLQDTLTERFTSQYSKR